MCFLQDVKDNEDRNVSPVRGTLIVSMRNWGGSLKVARLRKVSFGGALPTWST
jgi:hypothetical protein